MTNDKAEMRQAIYGALLRHVDKFGKYSDIQKTIDEIIDRLAELQPVNPDKIAKDAIAFTLRFIENSLCDQMSNGIFNDFKNTQK